MTQVSIITIGDELLIGQVIDTNSAWMAQELNQYGIGVVRQVAVGDIWDHIWKALNEEQQHADIILITGGLGPTADDITKSLLCAYFGANMVVNDAARQNVIDIFTKINRPITERNLLQAEVPDLCTVLMNKRGTAPGMWFKKEGKVFVSLPGVPHELRGLMIEEVIPRLLQEFIFPVFIHKTLLTAGVGESFLADHIRDFEEALPAHIRLAYLPNYGMVRLRLSGTGSEKKSLESEIRSLFETLQILVADHLVTTRDEKMEAVVGKLLLLNHKKLCTAESCTGGYIAHLLTSIPGSSNFYDGSVVSYSYAAKEDLLQVDHDTLETKGAVSEEIVIQMAKGALKNIGSDYVIAISGIMGPDGGMPDKPVGTVWVAVGNNNNLQTHKFAFRFDRMRNIQLTAAHALNFLRKFILSEA